MKKHDLKPEEVPAKYAVHDTKGFAWFRCPSRDNGWPSAHAWCTMNLRNQTIYDYFSQDCRKCESSVNPRFTTEGIEKMAEYAVMRCLRPMGRMAGRAPTREDTEMQGGPHQENRCGKCKALKRSCWK